MSEGHPSRRDALISLLMHAGDQAADERAVMARVFVDVLRTGYNFLCLKCYRIDAEPLPGVPTTPCLDHETQLHEHDRPHVGGYVQDRHSGALMSVVYIPSRRRIVVEEESPGATAEMARLESFLRARFPGHEVGSRRVPSRSAAARARHVAEAHLPLEEVLCGVSFDAMRGRLARLSGIASLMEKASRVSSWGVRTAYTPLAAAVAFLLVLVLPVHGQGITEWGASDWARAVLLLAFGGGFLYYGLKAVQLTAAATFVDKRIREYGFILDERRAWAQGGGAKAIPPEWPSAALEAAGAAFEALAPWRSDEAARKGALVAAHLATARVLTGEAVGPVDEPLARAVLRVRAALLVDAAERSRRRVAELEASGEDSHTVAEQRRQRERLATLEAKLARAALGLGRS